MKALMFLAEAATSHQDGTMSVLRAWIDQVTASAIPARFHGAIVARILPEPGDEGDHRFAIQVRAPSGTVFAEFSGDFKAADDGKAMMVLTNIVLVLPEPGRNVFSFQVDGAELASWPLMALQEAKQGAA